MVIGKMDFLKVLIATVAVFLIGLSIGFVLDTSRTNFLAEELRAANLQTERFVVGRMYLDKIEDRENFCALMRDRIQDISKDTRRFGDDLQNFGEAGMFREKDYKYIRDRYYLYQVRFMMMLEDYRDRCGKNSATLMYFFGDNIQSTRQGSVITEVRKENQGKIFVFTFQADTESNTPVVDMIQRDFNITSTPTMVINNQRVLKGFKSKQQLEQELEESINGTL
ncbi:MAG: hypothetical protein SVV03_03290 [Candidatus Nanohaloarchaea archaeon]|nr:hypothetical protein [Candidatus Nanohaloarchaea archaeon]